MKISKSVFVTNFLEGYTARDLWKVCNDYGTVVDIFISFKKLKAGKCFAFVRFIKVINLDRLVENLHTIWIGRYHLHANVARFQRPNKPITSIPRGSNMGSSKDSFASVLKDGFLSPVKEHDSFKPALVLDDSCIKEHDFSLSLMGKVKDVYAIPNLYIILSNKGFHNIKLTYLGGMWVLLELDTIESKEKLLNHTGKAVKLASLHVRSYNLTCPPDKIVYDRCRIASEGREIVEWEDSDSKSLSSKLLCLKTKIDDIINERRKIIIQGKVLWIRAKELNAWVPTFLEDNQDDSSSDDESQENVVEDIDGDKENNKLSDVDRVSQSSFSHANDIVHENSNNNKTGDVGSHSEDPFNLYGILNGQHKKASNSSIEPEYPPGFTPVNNKGDNINVESIHAVNEQVQSLSSKLKERNTNDGVSPQHSINTCSLKNNVGGSILDVMDELVKVRQTMGYNMEGCVKNIEAIIGSQGDFDVFR
ncbi:RNA-directed DNA polymerase, eukaryota, nucleotide-binding alpha-beta plait domain protein [Tanacetum coccineum]